VPAKYASTWQRLNAFLAKMIVRLWPDQTRQWGRAFEAELSVIADPFASVRWLAGGVMLLTRERWKSFFESLGRPFGVPPGGPAEVPGKNWARAPHTPRWATMLLLLASAAIFTHPEVRESLSSVIENYTHSGWKPSRWRSVKKLQKEAETNRDPQLLAWLSLLSTDQAERLRLSQEAIEKDPSLTWLDYEQSLFPLNDLSNQHYLSMDRIERLQRWDPDNAVPHLLMAEVISEPVRSEARRALIRNGTKIEWEKEITRNSRWLAEMERAFSAPRFDSYVLAEFQLVRAISEKYGIEDPDPTLYILMHARVFRFEMLEAYVNHLMDVGAEAEVFGNTSAAASLYGQILAFAERLSTGQSRPIEKMFACEIGMKAGAKSQPILKSAGRADEEMLLASQLAEWAAGRDQQLRRPAKQKSKKWKTAGWDGLAIQVITAVVVFLSSIYTVSQIVVLRGPRRGPERRNTTYAFFCRIADCGPFLLFIASVALFFVYHPYAKAYKTYLSNQSLPDMDSLFVAASVTRFLPARLHWYGDHAGTIFWTAVSLVLTLIAAFLIVRMLTREIVTRFR
jgi:hypothetical protein